MKKLQLMIGISMALLAGGGCMETSRDVNLAGSTAQARQGHQEQPIQTASSGKLISGRYLDNGDGTITDTKTQLTWKKCSEGQSGDNCSGEPAKYEWDDAMAKFGKGEWRLPTKDELKSLVYFSNGKPTPLPDLKWCSDDGKGFQNPTINQQAFPNTPERGWYWSSTVNDESIVWFVGFDVGYASWSVRGGVLPVRLVRSGQ